jgi:hypothetical protein
MFTATTDQLIYKENFVLRHDETVFTHKRNEILFLVDTSLEVENII